MTSNFRQCDELFATPVFQSEIDTSVCKECADEVLKLINIDRLPDTIIETTRDNLHTLSQFNKIKQLIDIEVQVYSKEFLGIIEDSLELSCMWSNVQIHGGVHHFHNHANSFITGVVYLNIPKGNMPGNFAVLDPRPGKTMQEADFYKNSSISNSAHTYSVATGKMIIFPSWLPHGTFRFVNTENENRISLSFNYRLKQCSSHTASF
jgi:uncharacterized protein (TIGR02466 family)